MQNGQVSVWLPIIVGVIGLVGVIAGQLVNAWREDRRWKRDQAREDLRWSRERKTEEIRLRQEDALNWREFKTRTYARFISNLRDVITATSVCDNFLYLNDHRSDVEKKLRVWRPSFPPETQVEFDKLTEIRAQKIYAANDVETEVRLICSDELAACIEKYHGVTGLPGPYYPGESFGPKSAEPAPTSFSPIVHVRKYYDEFQECARRELLFVQPLDRT